VLDVTSLSVSIDGTPILMDVSFHLERGDRVGLIGESGSGKSMTALALLGLLPEGATTSGSIRVGDADVLTLPERALAALRGGQIAMVFQEPMTALDPLMPVGAQVAEAVALHSDVSRGAARSRARDLLAQVELPDPDRAMRAYPYQLSGGQRQRDVRAWAMANDPQVLVCDEATTALDVTIQRKVLDLVERLVDEHGTALLFITHDLAVVSRLCESVVVLYGGRVVEAGPLDVVFGSPRHPYTAGLLAASDLASAAPGKPLPTIPGSVPAAGDFPPGCPFRGRCDRELPDCVELPAATDDGAGHSFHCHNPIARPRRRKAAS
jgi:peptide/nickel transport system ATP-binding protein